MLAGLKDGVDWVVDRHNAPHTREGRMPNVELTLTTRFGEEKGQPIDILQRVDEIETDPTQRAIYDGGLSYTFTHDPKNKRIIVETADRKRLEIDVRDPDDPKRFQAPKLFSLLVQQVVKFKGRGAFVCVFVYHREEHKIVGTSRDGVVLVIQTLGQRIPKAWRPLTNHLAHYHNLSKEERQAMNRNETPRLTCSFTHDPKRQLIIVETDNKNRFEIDVSDHRSTLFRSLVSRVVRFEGEGDFTCVFMHLRRAQKIVGKTGEEVVLAIETQHHTVPMVWRPLTEYLVEYLKIPQRETKVMHQETVRPKPEPEVAEAPEAEVPEAEAAEEQVVAAEAESAEEAEERPGLFKRVFGGETPVTKRSPISKLGLNARLESALIAAEVTTVGRAATLAAKGKPKAVADTADFGEVGYDDLLEALEAHKDELMIPEPAEK